MRRVHPIEKESYRILRGMVDLSRLGPLSRAVAERIIHASADPDYAESLVLDEGALENGTSALRRGAPVVTDVGMVAAGITGRHTRCFVSDPSTRTLSERLGITSSAAGFRLAAEEVGAGAVWIVGNAPTALFELLALDVAPSLVIGLPVGFVGAAESKAALVASGLPAVANRGPKGGSAVAAAALNALIYYEEDDVRQPVRFSDKNGAHGHEPGPALLIVGHGSRDPRGAREFHDLVGLVRRRNPSITVEGGFIELSRPPISECVDRLAESGALNVAAVPLMLLAAGHAKDDIPATLVREKTDHPKMSFSYGRALGIRPELLELMDERISAAVREEEKEETAVLVVGRGSSDPDANSDLYKIARLFYEGRPYPVVESAYVSMTPPDVADGLDRCFKLGAKRVVVFSYFLFTGVLEERIREQSETFAAANPGVEVRYAGYFGPDEKIADLVVERYTEAVEGDIRMNCDVCVHRVALPGFVEKVGAPATPHYHPDEPGHHLHDRHH